MLPSTSGAPAAREKAWSASARTGDMASTLTVAKFPAALIDS